MNQFDFIDISLTDILDILLVALLLFYLYKLVKGTVAINIFIGIVIIYFIWKITDLFKLDVLSNILGIFISVGFFALIVVFHLISLCLWGLCALVEKISPIFYLSIFVCLGLVFIQFLLVRNEEPDKCLKAFKQNNWIGFSIVVGTMLPYFIGV